MNYEAPVTDASAPISAAVDSNTCVTKVIREGLQGMDKDDDGDDGDDG